MLALPRLIKLYWVLKSVCIAFDRLGTGAANSAGQLAIEQVYGYMCWNSQVYGILTTATGFVFLFRDDVGNLWISQMFASHESLATGGYVLPSSLAQNPRFTISHLLYWFTHLTETTERLIERDLAQVIQVVDRYQTKPARPPVMNVTNQPYMSQIPQSSNADAAGGGYGGYHTFSLEPVDELLLDFKPWLEDSRCGGLAFRGSLVEGNQLIISK